MANSLADALKTLHTLPGTFNPPATTDQINSLEMHLNERLNDELLSLYRDHNGIQADWHQVDERFVFALRLMSCEEVIAADQMFQEYHSLHPEYAPPPEVRFFWTDDESNYAGFYLSGKLAGKVLLYDHEDIDFAPRFRSVASFYDGFLETMARHYEPENPPAWYDMPCDYPLFEDNPETDESDLKLALEFTEQFEMVTDRRFETRFHRLYLGFTAINLTPFSASDKLLPFTYNTDMWIQARACEILGQRRYLPAIPRLGEVALDGTHNGRLAATGALGHMRTDEAKAVLLELQSQLPSDRVDCVKAALKRFYQDSGN